MEQDIYCVRCIEPYEDDEGEHHEGEKKPIFCLECGVCAECEHLCDCSKSQ